MADALAKKELPSSTEAAAAGATKKKADLVGLVLIALVTLNLISLCAMGFLMQKVWIKIHDLETHVVINNAVSEGTEKTSLGKELQPQSLGALVPLESFLVNINSDQGTKFLQVQMELELSEPTMEEEVARKKAAIRDAIIVLLSTRTYKQLREPQGLPMLRGDIVKVTNRLLTTGKIKEVFFTQFHFN